MYQISSKPTEQEIPTYTFATISFKDLENLVKIKKNIETKVFHKWFDAKIRIVPSIILT